MSGNKSLTIKDHLLSQILHGYTVDPLGKHHRTEHGVMAEALLDIIDRLERIEAMQEKPQPATCQPCEAMDCLGCSCSCHQPATCQPCEAMDCLGCSCSCHQPAAPTASPLDAYRRAKEKA